MRSSSQRVFRLDDGKNLLATFVLVSSLFLIWGFCNGMIDVMDKHFQEELHLSLSQSAWVQFAHYLGYFLMSLPAGWLATKLGYKGGIITGLLTVAAGGLWFIPATQINSFWAFLLGVCVISSGLTFLETIANPYTTVLGPSRFAATRINLAQSANGVGWIFGPIAGGLFFYGTDSAGKSTAGQTLWIPYAAVAGVVIVLAIVFLFAEVPDIKPDDEQRNAEARTDSSVSIWKRPHFVLAVVAQCFYVAAQAGIFSFFINYMTSQVPPIPAAWRTGLLGKLFTNGSDGLLHVSNQGAATLASVGFICFLLGRLTGAGIVKKYPAHKVLGLYGVLNTIVCFVVFLKLGWISVACVFLSYFFMSIMFPTIFALGIFGLGSQARKASAFIVMAIIGGAVLPKLMGFVADRYDMSRGFIVPLFCFAFVAFYGLNWARFSKAQSLDQSKPKTGTKGKSRKLGIEGDNAQRNFPAYFPGPTQNHDGDGSRR